MSTRFTTEVKDKNDSDETRAGAHPHSARAQIDFTSYDAMVGFGKLSPIDDPRHIITRLPQGFTGNPEVAEKCPIVMVAYEGRPGYPPACPRRSWVGIMVLKGTVDVSQPVVSIEPEPGYPAEFGFTEAGMTYTMYPEIRSESDFGLNVVVPRTTVNGITSIDMRFCSWGVVVTHQGSVSGSSTYRCLEEGEPGAFEKPFLTNPATECPAGSRIGHVQAAVGSGPNPLWVPQAGKAPTSVSLTGPYNGAPYGLSIVVPAQAGPFELGRVVVRSALHVDEQTAAITTGVEETRLINPDGTVTDVLSGDLPRIIKGLILNQRDIRVIVDRENFMVNPTDCSQKQITAELHAYGGGQVDVSNRFRAAECAVLGFAPRFNARILDRGRKSTLRSWHPRTRFTVVPRKGDANIAGARVALPSSTILDQGNIGTTCTRIKMAERACPSRSLVGYVKAWSPLLRRAIEGPVYLAANGGARPLPDLTAVLDGEIRVVLQGEISTLRTGGKARLQNTFRVVPDAPVTRFVLTMRGGKNTGLLVNSTDLCRTNERGVAVFAGQNGRRHRLRPRIATAFKGCAKVRRQAARRTAQRKQARKAAARSAAREVR